MPNITAWKCPACGAVLTTQGGAKRHMERCKEVEDRIIGQVDMWEMEAESALAEPQKPYSPPL